MLGREPGPARIERAGIGRIAQLRWREHRPGPRCPSRERVARQKTLGAAILQADGDPVGRGVGIEGQPCSARLRDRDLRDQEIRAALHPQADYVSRTDPEPHQTAGELVRGAVDLRIAITAPVEHEGGMIGPRGGRRSKDLRENLVADQVVAQRPPEECARARLREQRATFFQNLHDDRPTRLPVWRAQAPAEVRAGSLAVPTGNCPGHAPQPPAPNLCGRTGLTGGELDEPTLGSEHYRQ